MKREFTVGEIARILNVARSTVINWIKDGEIDAFQLPGGNNRVPRENLVHFMRKYDIPISFLEETIAKRILVIHDDVKALAEMCASLEKIGDVQTRITDSPFEAGLLICEFRPHAIVLRTGLEGIDHNKAHDFLSQHPEISRTKLVALTPGLNNDLKRKLKDKGFTLCLDTEMDSGDIEGKIKKILKI